MPPLIPADAVEMRRRIVAWQGVDRSWDRARGYDGLRIFDVLLATDARIGEVLALTGGDVYGLDGDGPVTVHIGHRLDEKSHRVAGRKAGGDPYTVTIPEFGAAALREQRALGTPFDPVFPTRRGTHQSEANVRTHWRDPRRGLQVGCPVLDPQVRGHRGGTVDGAGSHRPAGRAQQQ